MTAKPLKSKGSRSGTAWTPARSRRLRALFATVPYPKHLGMNLRNLDKGTATVAMPARKALQQYQGITHGGALSSLADTAATFAAMTILPDGIDVITVEFKINFLEAMQKGRAVAEGRIVRMGRRVTLAQVEVYSSPKHRHLATGTFTMLNFETAPGDSPG